MEAKENIDRYINKAVDYLSDGTGKMGDGNYFKTQIQLILYALMFQLDEQFYGVKRSKEVKK